MKCRPYLVAESTRSVEEDVQNGRFQVTFELSYDAIENVTFNFQLEGITAKKGTDFIEPTNRSESISANSNETSITIQITPDEINEGNETFKIVVTDISNAISSTGLTTFEQIITIADDEMPTLSISNSSFEVAEDVTGGNFIIDYELSGATQTVVSFNYTLTASTATTGSDYTVPNSLTETIAIGNTSGMITIAIDDDDMNEGNETFTIEIMDLTGALFSDKTTTFAQEITIIDDEVPAIEVASNNIDVNENVNNGMVNLVVNLAGPTENPVVIGYETINGTAESPSDFTASAGSSNVTQTIAAGMTSTTIQIPIIDDNRNEGNEVFTLRITHLTRLGTTDPQAPIDVTIKIIDNEIPTFSLANETFEVAENIAGGKFNVNFIISGATGREVTFMYTLMNGTALLDSDFIMPSISVSITAGQTTTTPLPIPIMDDSMNEGNETFTLAISNILGAKAADGSNAFSQLITIVDNENPTIKFAQPNIEIAETSGLVEVVVNLSGATANAVMFSYNTENDTAQSPDDYMGIAIENAQTTTIATGSTTTTLRIPIIDDSANEGNEEFKLKITNATNSVFANNLTEIEITLTIIDNEVPTLSLTNSTFEVQENVAGGNFVITTALSNETENKVTFNFALVSNSATLGIDFTEPSNLIRTIAMGQTTTMIEIAIINDDENEGNEEFSLEISNLVGAVFSDGLTAHTQTITIIDDESPTIMFAESNLEIAENVEGGMVDIVVSLSGVTSKEVVISYETVDDSAESPADFTGITSASNTTTPVVSGQTSVTIQIPIINDELNEGNEEFKVKITNATNAVLVSNADSIEVTVKIIDDERPEVSIRVMNSPILGSEAATFVISTNSAIIDPISVRIYTHQVGNVLQGTTGESRIEIPAKETEQVVTLTTIELSDDNAGGSVTMIILAGDETTPAYTLATESQLQSATILVRNSTIISIESTTSGNAVMEGNPVTFRLTSRGLTTENAIVVNLDVSVIGDFLSWRVPRLAVVPNTEDDRSIEVNIQTDDDLTKETTGTIVVELLPGNGYDLTSEKSISVTINDNDQGVEVPTDDSRISIADNAVQSILNVIRNNPPTESEAPSPTNPNIPTVSIDSIHSQVEEGGSVEFDINANGGSEIAATNIKMSVNPVGDFFEFNEPQRISRQILGQELVRVVFPTIDDTLAEADGRLEVSIIPDSSYRIAANKSSTSVIVSDAVDRQVQQDLLTASSQAFLPDVVGNMTVRTTDLISQRVKQGINESNNISLNLGGQSSLRGLIEMSGEMANKDSIDWREVLGDSSFTLTLLSGEDFVTPTTIWGVGDNRSLSSSSSSQAWSGDVFTGQFGIDTLINQEYLTGLSASVVENEIEIENEYADGLEFTLNSTTLNPYFSWHSPTQKAELQVVAGLGIGEFNINQADYEFETLASRSYSFALSGRKELYTSDSILNGVTKLNIIGDSWFASNYIEGQADLLTNLQTDAHYLRLRTEGTHQFSLARGSLLTPLISVGIRDDRKDQLTNFGMELSSGFDYTDPIGLKLSGSGSMLYAGENTIQKMSINGTLGYDYGNDALGLTFAISPSWGQTLASIQNSLWSSNILANDKEVGQYTDGTQVSSELGYGFTLGEESRKLNLYSGYEFDAESDDQLSLGSSVSIGSHLSLDVEGTRAINAQETEATKYQFNARLSW